MPDIERGDGWHVVEQVDDDGYVLLAHPDHEGPTGHRLAVPTTLDDDGLGSEVLPVYPCRACGWEKACGGECHS